MKNNKGFTLVELMVVIAIIGLIASITIVSVKKVMDKAYSARARAEIRELGMALELYLMDNNYQYPCDVNRNLPSGLQNYLSTNPEWPKAPWPGSVYDWDYWHPDPSSTGCKIPSEVPSCQPTGYCAGTLSDLSQGSVPVYQLSIRFCDIDGNNCNYPEWATGWDKDSSAYWCVSGPCRAHGGKPYNHPGCCIGGSCPAGQTPCPSMLY